ncbi:hypothetical protein [Streptacidiphilus sp. PAMC 29251]
MTHIDAYLLLIGITERVHPIRVGALLLAAIALIAYLVSDLTRRPKDDQ